MPARRTTLGLPNGATVGYNCVSDSRWAHVKPKMQPSTASTTKTNKAASSYPVIERLIRDSGHYSSSEEFASFLAAQFSDSTLPAGDIEKTVTALSIALGVYVRRESGKPSDRRICSFCGKPSEGVRVMLTSIESNICDECLFSGLVTVSEGKGQFHLRFALAIYRLVARVGYMFSRVVSR